MAASSFDRRRLLTNAVLGGATVLGATALGSLAPETAFAATTPDVLPGTPDPNFAEGRVSAVIGSTLSVTGSDRVLHRIQVTGATSIWKLHEVSFDQIAVGDGLYARGVPLPDGSLAADALWVNIVNLHAQIVGIDRASLQLNHNGKRVVGQVLPKVTAAVYNGTPAISDLSKLQVGQHIQLVGAWVPDTNAVQVATVFATV